jgi:hypothetical protein
MKNGGMAQARGAFTPLGMVHGLTTMLFRMVRINIYFDGGKRPQCGVGPAKEFSI